ncbi:MAG: hypothetical protein A3G24_19270 [Betaproteobacteria bacterium RIFCSPLOWO2_12_FULL_62_13]|nr:MAG: hypothetical protein A3G24_19270 [Betaproteobacteria bacterium RIFCSPLOWO2_12_FULL_62_13]
MSDAWKELDFAGGGLQNANIRLAALLRKRRVAYALLALFPLGLHRDYLHDRRGAWLYRGGTLLGVAALLSGQTSLAGLVLAAGAAFAIYDLVRTDDRQPGTQEDSGHEPLPSADTRTGRRASSFAEQEKRLRELAATRRKNSE